MIDLTEWFFYVFVCVCVCVCVWSDDHCHTHTRTRTNTHRYTQKKIYSVKSCLLRTLLLFATARSGRQPQFCRERVCIIVHTHTHTHNLQYDHTQWYANLTHTHTHTHTHIHTQKRSYKSQCKHSLSIFFFFSISQTSFFLYRIIVGINPLVEDKLPCYWICVKTSIYHIYQPLRSGRIWHKINF